MTWVVTNILGGNMDGTTTVPENIPGELLVTEDSTGYFVHDVSGYDAGTQITFNYHYTMDGDKPGVEWKWEVLTDTLDVPACEEGPTKVAAVNGKFSDPCGSAFNLAFKPARTDGVEYYTTREGNTLTAHARVLDKENFELTNPDWAQSMTDALTHCSVNDDDDADEGYPAESPTGDAADGVGANSDLATSIGGLLIVAFMVLATKRRPNTSLH